MKASFAADLATTHAHTPSLKRSRLQLRPMAHSDGAVVERNIPTPREQACRRSGRCPWK